ncbi:MULTISPECIES: hypothetical protein [unclassified Mesorhizobium]|uniref:hypothetical protein n=1 Tax=unclassified Mesorhizobium TaxID=325217 RepID=UPI000BAE9E02|nr:MULTISPECIES: hypothetical protein [unclassified Mesorhizobium]PBB22162.1 hypothetical protein CK232_34695 [Mesorhizobium sp. WSM4304]PBB70856.1 hypothetical protein CK227_35185 [Mesorhizobium sp. WSM4308]
MQTITGLFDNYDDANDAMGELVATGVPRDEISIVANNATGWYKADETEAGEDAAAGAGLGAVIGGAGGLATGLGLMAIPGLGPVVAAGWLAATAVGAVGGAVVGGAAGGIIGAMTKAGVPENDAHVYAEGVRRGGTMVTARVEDNLAPNAEQILKQYNSVDIADRRSEYEVSGWTGFDPEADVYPEEDLRRVGRGRDL